MPAFLYHLAELISHLYLLSLILTSDDGVMSKQHPPPPPFVQLSAPPSSGEDSFASENAIFKHESTPKTPPPQPKWRLPLFVSTVAAPHPTRRNPSFSASRHQPRWSHRSNICRPWSGARGSVAGENGLRVYALLTTPDRVPILEPDLVQRFSLQPDE